MIDFKKGEERERGEIDSKIKRVRIYHPLSKKKIQCSKRGDDAELHQHSNIIQIQIIVCFFLIIHFWNAAMHIYHTGGILVHSF